MHQVFSPQYLSSWQTDLNALALSCRANVTEQLCEACFDFPWECESPAWDRASGDFATEK